MDTQREKDLALINACTHGKKDVAKLLIKVEANINAKGEEGETPLICASRYNRKDIVKLLIKAGVDANATDIYGWTALMYACKDLTGLTSLELSRAAKIVKLLVEKARVGLDTKNNKGFTAIMLACEKDIRFIGERKKHFAMKIRRLLIEHGANMEHLTDIILIE